MFRVTVIKALGHLMHLAPGGQVVFLWQAFYLKALSALSGLKTLHLCRVVDFLGELTWLSPYAQIGHVAPDRKHMLGLVGQT